MELTTLGILVTEKCNFNCKYCFYRDNRSKSDLKFDDVKKTLDILFMSSKFNMISFFGGEPLLRYDLIKKIVKYCSQSSSRKMKYSITTNISLLDQEKIDFFKEYNFKLLVSIDGGEETQNQSRKMANEGPTFDSIKKKLPLLASYPIKTRANMVVTENSLSKLYNNYKFLKDSGFKEILVSYENEEFVTAQKNKVDIFFKQFDKVVNDSINSYRSKILINICQLDVNIKSYLNYKDRIAFPDPVCSSVTLDADGSLLPCVGISSNPSEKRLKFNVSNLMSLVSQRNRLFNRVNSTYSKLREKCKSCEFATICEGFCLVFAKYAKQSTNVEQLWDRNCYFMIKTFESSFKLFLTLTLESNDLFMNKYGLNKREKQSILPYKDIKFLNFNDNTFKKLLKSSSNKSNKYYFLKFLKNDINLNKINENKKLLLEFFKIYKNKIINPLPFCLLSEGMLKNNKSCFNCGRGCVSKEGVKKRKVKEISLCGFNTTLNPIELKNSYYVREFVSYYNQKNISQVCEGCEMYKTKGCKGVCKNILN